MATQQPLLNRVRSSQETLHELVANLEVIRIGLEAYRDNRVPAWRIASSRLHLLLTDWSRPNGPLALRVLPNMRLHPLRSEANFGLGIGTFPARASLPPFDLLGLAWISESTDNPHGALDYLVQALAKAKAGGYQTAIDRAVRALVGTYNSLGSSEMTDGNDENAVPQVARFRPVH